MQENKRVFGLRIIVNEVKLKKKKKNKKSQTKIKELLSRLTLTASWNTSLIIYGLRYQKVQTVRVIIHGVPTGMNAVMSLEVIISNESFITLITFMRFFSSMSKCMA